MLKFSNNFFLLIFSFFFLSSFSSILAAEDDDRPFDNYILKKGGIIFFVGYDCDFSPSLKLKKTEVNEEASLIEKVLPNKKVDDEINFLKKNRNAFSISFGYKTNTYKFFFVNSFLKLSFGKLIEVDNFSKFNIEKHQELLNRIGSKSLTFMIQPGISFGNNEVYGAAGIQVNISNCPISICYGGGYKRYFLEKFFVDLGYLYKDSIVFNCHSIQINFGIKF